MSYTNLLTINFLLTNIIKNHFRDRKPPYSRSQYWVINGSACIHCFAETLKPLMIRAKMSTAAFNDVLIFIICQERIVSRKTCLSYFAATKERKTFTNNGASTIGHGGSKPHSQKRMTQGHWGHKPTEIGSMIRIYIAYFLIRTLTVNG
jgi:hypothetical protein